MSDTSVPMDADAMRSTLTDVAQELGPYGPQHTVVIVGGAHLALTGVRESTVDIDSITLLDDELKSAITSVALNRGIQLNWLNDDARGFTPATFELRECEVVFDSDRLRVLAAPMRQVFVMKLYRSNARDFEDMTAIWSRCNFDSPREVVELFYQAYPHAPDDEFLEDFVKQIADAAAQN
jgi:hypothetical protein